jgi:hypothetical protein
MALAPGARLGPFEILAPLGAGGMGEVYRGRDTRLDRSVAIKVLPSETLNGSSRRVDRFRHEARVIARITHPNICALFDVGEEEGTVFLVMEYVEGVTLARRLEDGPLPIGLALRTATGIADALDHAHRAGVVHRDLKPGNVMLTHDGVKLLDFGLAKLTSRDEEGVTDPTRTEHLTAVGSIVGTLPYMAPEQIEGRDVDARTDIFSLGVVLYEMLSGRPPFAGNSRAALMAAIVASEPRPPSSLQPQVPAALDRLILRCLSKDADDRWQTARDVAADLRWIAEPGSGLRTANASGRWMRRPALRGALAGAALAATALAVLAALVWPRSVERTVSPVTFRKGIVPSARFMADGSFVFSASWDGGAYGTFLGRPMGGDARDLQLADSRILSVSRTGEMAVLFGPQNSTHTFGNRVLANIPAAGVARRDIIPGVVDADWIPGTDTLAVIRDPGDGGPWTVEFPAGTPVYKAPAAWSLRVSPDGTRVAFFEGPEMFTSPPHAMVTIVDKGRVARTLSRGWAGIGLAWTPSGSEIWFTATRPGLGPPHIRAVSLSGKERQVYIAPDWLVLHDISASGRVLLSRNSVRIALVCKPSGDALERDLTWTWASQPTSMASHGESVVFEDELNSTPSGDPAIFLRPLDGSPAVAIGEGAGGVLSPDGRWVLARAGDRLVLLPTGAGDAVTLPNGNLKRMENGSWLSDSKTVVFTGYADNGESGGYILEVPNGMPRPITPNGVILARRATVRDDNHILGRVGSVWTLFPTRGGETQPVSALRPADFPIEWSQDGRYVYIVESASGARPPGADVWRVELGIGRRTRWKTLTPADPVGVEDMRESVVMTAGGQSYCYSYLRRLGDLIIVDGLE